MNIFFVSPGRTATTTLAAAFSCVRGYTSSHESRVKMLGWERVNYPVMHFEFDNRLTWFLPRLTKKYGDSGGLVIVHRDRHDIAKSYDKRWGFIHMMKAYSQGILLRDFGENGFDVCEDYVDNVYEHLEYFRRDWSMSFDIDISCPDEGVSKILSFLGKEEHIEDVLDVLRKDVLNRSEASLKRRMRTVKYNLRNLVFDLRRGG